MKKMRVTKSKCDFCCGHINEYHGHTCKVNGENLHFCSCVCCLKFLYRKHQTVIGVSVLTVILIVIKLVTQ